MGRSEYVRGWPNYVVFDDGDIVNIKTGRTLKPGDNGNGSVHVYLSNGNDRKKTIQVRKIVAEAFLPMRPSPDHVLSHIDGDYHNCAADNLEWRTRSNIQFRRVLRESEDHDEIRKVRIIETGEVFDNIFDCADYLDGDAKFIHRTTLNSNWEYKGYRFEYI